MPRGKLQLIDDPRKRKCTYRKRIRGLKQKTYELSTLCGVDAFMLSYGPSGEAEAWPENRQENIRDAIFHYSGPKTADAPNRNEFSEALELRLRKVRERIQLLTKQRGPADTEELFEEDIFSWMDFGEEGITCDGIPCPTDTGFPRFPPDLFLSESTGDGWEEMIAAGNGGVRASVEPYVELTDLVSCPPTDTGFSQLSSEPCLGESGVSQVASTDDDLQSLGPFDSTLGGLTQLPSEDCFHVSDIIGINFSPSGLGDGHDSELFASNWPAGDIGFDDQHYFTNGPRNCSYDDLEDVGSQPCCLWTF